jgi:hypothetical protein
MRPARVVGKQRLRAITGIVTWTAFAVLMLLNVMLAGGTDVAAQCLTAISILVPDVHTVVALGWRRPPSLRQLAS